MRKVLAKINLRAIEDNAKAFKRLTATGLCAVVKADAYGHGAEAVTSALSGVADFFAVALVEEAAAIKVAAAGKPILILTPPTDRDSILYAAKNGFTLSLSDPSSARMAVEVCKTFDTTLDVHLQINTGMNRYGANVQTLGKIAKLLLGTPVRVTGAYSHLYTQSESVCKAQRAKFLSAKKVLSAYYPEGVTYHLSATYGATLGRAYAFDAVRVGLGLYGYLPQGENGEVYLKKAMTVYARTVQNRKYTDGGAGYGVLDGHARSMLKKDRRTSVLRLGYADGFSRSDRGEKGLSPLCMDCSVRLGSEKKGKLLPVLTDAEETAKRRNTIPYEVLCAATKRAEIVYEYE